MFVEFQQINKRESDDAFHVGATVLVAASHIVGFQFSDRVQVGSTRSPRMDCSHMLLANSVSKMVAGTAVNNAERVADALFLFERNVRLAASPEHSGELVPALSAVEAITDEELRLATEKRTDGGGR